MDTLECDTASNTSRISHMYTDQHQEAPEYSQWRITALFKRGDQRGSDRKDVSEMCPVCMDDFHACDMVDHWLCSLHRVCKYCIVKGRDRMKSCPICRQPHVTFDFHHLHNEELSFDEHFHTYQDIIISNMIIPDIIINIMPINNNIRNDIIITNMITN